MNNVVSIKDAPSIRTEERTKESTHQELEYQRWHKAISRLLPLLDDLIAQPNDRLSMPFMPIRDDAFSMRETIHVCFPELLGDTDAPQEGF